VSIVGSLNVAQITFHEATTMKTVPLCLPGIISTDDFERYAVIAFLSTVSVIRGDKYV